jgi:hypothetical protein
MLDRAEPTLTAPPSAAARDGLAIHVLLWSLIAVYLALLGTWSYHAGMQLRDDAWTTTRSIRFHSDIAAGMGWGRRVLSTAQRLAPAGDNQRSLTFFQLYRGLDQVYQDLVVGEPPEGDYQLDYPPLRLLTMTLWTQHATREHPGLRGWPNQWAMHYSPTGDPAALVNEDIAQPMLLFNTYCVAVAAIFSFFLVWIWVHRGGRPNKPGKRELVPWKPLPLRQINGLLLFPIAAAAFLYAVVIAENPVPAPPPSAAFAGAPILIHDNGKTHAVVTATIDGQGSDAQWRIEWGTTLLYGNQSSWDSAGSDDVSASTSELPPNTLIHYRISARNDRGLTHTADATFNTADAKAPTPPRHAEGAAWLAWPLWLGIALLFVVMAGAMSVLPPVHRGWAAGLIAALLLWFDPSLLLDAHVWPQWDVWVLPPLMLAALLATLDCWFFAGVVMGVGVMFKGQTMGLGSILALWPLFAGRFGALGRLITGFVLSAGLVLSPWLVLDNAPADWNVGPLRWITALLAAAVTAAAISFYRRPLRQRAIALWHELKDEWHGQSSNADRQQTSIFDLTIFCASLLAGIVLITMLVLRRWPSDAELPRITGLFLLLGILLPPWFLPRRALGVWIAAVLAAGIWMSAYLYHGDWTWKTVGFEYGARKHDTMALGAGINGNLPQILSTRFGWDLHDPVMTLRPPIRISAPITLDLRQFLIVVYAVLLALAGIGAAIQSRRNHPRLLAALSAVCVLMPNILCQMASRYQMWGAAATCILIGVSPGLTLLHIVLALLAAGMIGAQLMIPDPSRSPQLNDIVRRFSPDDGWIILAIAAILLYVALIPGRRPSKLELASS